MFDDTDHSDDDDDEEDNNAVGDGDNENAITPVRRRGSKRNGTARVQDEDGADRNALLRNLTQSVSAIANRRRDEIGVDNGNPQMAWAALLGLKVIDMAPAARERFKLKVDTLALDFLEGNWDPNL